MIDYKKNKNLTRWIVILPIAGVIITALLLVKIFIDQQRLIYQEDSYNLRINIIKKTKKDANEKVLEVENFVKINKDILKEEAKNEVKNIVHLAVKIMEDTYNNYQDLPNEVILSKIKDRLREIRFFDNLSGYFFIYDLDGNNIMLPPSPTLENTNLLHIKDAKGNYPVREVRDIVKKNGKGFHEWYWGKPGSSILKKKIGYAELFKPLGIFIGTAKYEEDIINSIKKEIQKLLINTRYGEKGYIFAFDYDGNVISHANKDYIGTNRWNVEVNDVNIVQNVVKGAKLVEDGFFITYTSSYDPVTKKEAFKTSFIKNLPELSWVIGTGVYYEDILNEIQGKDKLLEEKLDNTINNIALMTIMILILVSLSTLFIFIKFRKVLKSYNDDLIDKNIQTTEQKVQLVHQLEHDALTSLPNRLLLSQKLEDAILHAQRNNNQIAVMFIDIDNFKSINDSLGHDIGDILLKEVAKRLKKSIRRSDVVARLSGDEFIILIDDCQSTHNICKIVDNIQENMHYPILLNKVEHKISVSIGISIFPEDGEDAQTLLKHADIAMYKVKEDGKNHYRFFTAKINDEIQRRIEVEKALHVAIKKKEFVLFYQPTVDAMTGNIEGVEALIRWKHPKRGLIFPDEFMPIAEESNLIIEIGNRVIYEALNQMKKWKEKGYGLKKISINIAARQLESHSLINYMKKTLQETSCKPEWIELEIVERFAMKNPAKSIEILSRLRKMKIDIAIDDFGTGYSSLAYIKQFPITKLKIDRAFVKNILTSYKDQAIAEAIIALASGLRLDIIAEGVESAKEKEFLLNQNCILMQGYLFSKPLPLDEIEKLLERGSI